MKYNISKNSKQKAYMQLYLEVRREILEGKLKYGSKLLSKRLMAEECGVSVVTVKSAYDILCDEGYVESRERSGYYVIYRSTDFISVPEEPHDTVLSGSYIPSKYDFPFSVLAKTMRKVISDRAQGILTKSPNNGMQELREAIASYLDRSMGIHCGERQIIIGSGAEYLYSLIARLFSFVFGNRCIFAIENPSYEMIKKVYTASGFECEELEIGKHGIRTGALESSKANVLHVTPFNSYPSGITASATKRAQYLDWANKNNAFIVEDNYESELTVSSKPEDTLFSLSDGNVIFLNTFSQTISASMRIGYMVLPEALLDIFEKNLGFFSCTVTVFEQYVLAELIESGEFERHISKVRRAKRRSMV